MNTPLTTDERTVCDGCGKEIDPDVCGCGDSIEHHSIMAGHSPIPMGCDCGREPAIEDLEAEQLRYGKLPPL